jgi:4-deoxy-L-threo-5-hexosulose-uronate ketol-isomerase
MEIRFSPGINEYKALNSEQLRSAYFIEKLFNKGQVDLVYSDVDRAVIGSAV